MNVARSSEEAELQARGINIAEQAAEEEAQAEIEIAELFDEIGAAELDELDQLGDTEQAPADAAPQEASDDEGENKDA